MRRPGFLAAFALAIGTGSALAADMPGRVYVAGAIAADGACANEGVLGAIQGRFAWAERNTWHRGFVMDTLENARPSGHAYYEPGLIRHDYCMADSVMTNGSPHVVYFAIEYGVGFASIGNYVDFCVLGLDPWHIHDGACRTVR